MSGPDLSMSGLSHYLSLEEIKTCKGGELMGILFIGLGLFIGIQVWAERAGRFNAWADYQEQFQFKKEQEDRKLMYEMFIGIE